MTDNMIDRLIRPGDWIAWRRGAEVQIGHVLIVTDLGVVLTDAQGVLSGKILAHNREYEAVEASVRGMS